MTVDGLKWRNATEGRGCTNKMVFARGSPILALSLRICKDIKIGLCVSNSSGFGSVRPIERRINADIEI